MSDGYNNHVIRTDDESLWFCFSGQVPRVGETVEPIGPDKVYKVVRVGWFMDENAHGSMCSARVFVEEVKNET